MDHGVTERMLAAHFCRIFPWLVVRTTLERIAGSSYVSPQTRGLPRRSWFEEQRGDEQPGQVTLPKNKLRASQCAGSRRESTHLRGRVGRGVPGTVSGLHSPSRALSWPVNDADNIYENIWGRVRAAMVRHPIYSATCGRVVGSCLPRVGAS
nr:uncharacterized protein LOC126539549 [Dermacentor andersoni]